GRANRGGVNDLAALGTVTVDEVRAMVGAVREVAPDVPITLMTFAAAGTDEGVERMRALGDALYGSLVGEPAAVADAMWSLAQALGVDRLQVTGWTAGTYAALAPELFG
ncbi:MAG TPA: hypothetical protein VF076_05985, partial [Acidimicrobiales bacterium]